MSALLSTFIKYCGVGGIATAFHYILFIALVKQLGWQPWLATLMAASVGAIIAYMLNYRFTFISNIAYIKSAPKFAVAAIIGIIFQTLIMLLLNTQWQWHYVLAQIIATFISLILTFVINNYWTFR